MSDPRTDPKSKLKPAEISAAGLDDWRQVLGNIRTRYATGNFATGLALVDAIGAAAEAVDHHPDITLTYGEVRVALHSHDVGGITSRDIELARTISALAREAGIGADLHGITEVELSLDSPDGQKLAPFYGALFGWEKSSTGDFVPSGQTPDLWFQGPDEDGAALPETQVPQRWHLDVWVPEDQAQARVEAVIAAGGTLVSDAEAPSYWVIEDAEGNRSCVCSVADR